jgi:flagellum-specific ATP synthase
VLSRRLAQAYHYPAIDVLQSVSRLASRVSGPASNKASGFIRRTMAVYAEAEDLINVGAYHSGSNPAIDESTAKHGPIEDFLIQSVDERSSLEDTLTAMSEITGLEIPPEEMADKLPKTEKDTERQEKAPGTAAGRPKAGAQQEAVMALNSVAALFSNSGAVPVFAPDVS